MATKDLFTKKSATLRRSAHQILNLEEREILKHVMRVYRQTGSLDTLCASLAKIVTDTSKLDLINLISDMFQIDLSVEFLRRCETRIPIYAMKRKQREATDAMNNRKTVSQNNNNNNNNNNSENENMCYNPSSFDANSTLNRSASTMVMSINPQCSTPSPPAPEKEVWRLSRSRSTPRACATVTPRTAPVYPAVEQSNQDDSSTSAADKHRDTMMQHTANLSYTAPRRSRIDNSYLLRQSSATEKRQPETAAAATEETGLDAGNLFARINEQITKVRPPLSLLTEQGFWQVQESPPTDETFIESRRRRRRSSSQIAEAKQISEVIGSSAVKAMMSESNISTLQSKSNNNNESQSFFPKSQQQETPKSVNNNSRSLFKTVQETSKSIPNDGRTIYKASKETPKSILNDTRSCYRTSEESPRYNSKVISSCEKKRHQLQSSKSASFDMTTPAFTPVLSNSKSSQNFRIPTIQVNKPMHNNIAKLTGRQNEEHGLKLGSESPPAMRRHSRRNRRELLFRAAEPPYDVEIKGVDEKDLNITSPFLPMTPQDSECCLRLITSLSKQEIFPEKQADEVDLSFVLYQTKDLVRLMVLESSEIQIVPDQFSFLCNSADLTVTPIQCITPVSSHSDLRVQIERSILDDAKLTSWSPPPPLPLVHPQQASLALQTDCHLTQDSSVQTLGQGLDSSTQTETDEEAGGSEELNGCSQ